MNQIDLNGRNAIITGGARGLGLAIAERLIVSGARCSLWDKDGEALEAASKSLEGKGGVNTVVVNVTSEKDVKLAFSADVKQFGSIDILVNSAGIAGTTKHLWELTLEEWKNVVDTNLNALFLCCKTAVPHMLEKGYGRIVNIASIAGKEGNPNASHYSASKAGVIGLTKSLGKELARTDIRVNCITPAVVQTDILKQVGQAHIEYMLSKIPMNRFGRVDEVASMVAWLCSEECSFSTGAVFDLSGGRATY